MGKKKRVDTNHRFTLRIDPVKHYELDAISFRHRLSLNVVYNEIVLFALNNGFEKHLNNTYPPDDRRGHFVYFKNEKTMSKGREL